jgi:hypothetical protein
MGVDDDLVVRSDMETRVKIPEAAVPLDEHPSAAQRNVPQLGAVFSEEPVS